MTSSGATEILPNLWLGSIKSSQNKEWIENHIDIVMNCTKDIDFISEKTHNLRFAVDDNLEREEIVRLYSYLENASKIIDTQLRQGKRILVHCMAGKKRSATIICAYIMIYLELSFQKSAMFLKMKRNCVFDPNCNFQLALLSLEKTLINKRKTIDM